ncbi:MAG: hypothetical protein HUJ56_03210, partial [Erysipelotrichaceae bacterium]|nr:hypothetical protein [Erysipelotrichaceae bacterium]
MKMSDIHVHSNESDGDQSVFRVALEASKCPQLQAIHISDHNHFSVLEPVKVNDRLMVYPGCEASVSLLGREQHILLLSQNALDKKLLTEFNALYKGLEEARYQHMVDTIT